MALSLALANNGTPPDSIDTKAEVGFQPGVGVTGSTLTVVGKVPGLSEEEFHRFAEEAKANCPISAALSIPITLNATFEADAAWLSLSEPLLARVSTSSTVNGSSTRRQFEPKCTAPSGHRRHAVLALMAVSGAVRSR